MQLLPKKDKPDYQYPPAPATEGAFMAVKDSFKHIEDAKINTLLVVNGRSFVLPGVQVVESNGTGGTPENPTPVTALSIIPGTPHDLAAAMMQHCEASLKPVFGSEYNI